MIFIVIYVLINYVLIKCLLIIRLYSNLFKSLTNLN